MKAGDRLLFEQKNIAVLNDPVLKAELKAFKMDKTAAGLMRYSAPDGKHDDTVMALAFAWYAANETYEPAFGVQYGEPFEFSHSNY